MKQEIKILKDLIEIKSTCDYSNKEIIFYIKKKLKKFESKIYKFKKNKLILYNLVVKIKGKNSKNPLVFSGHTDTVVVNSSWKKDPFKALIKDNKIFGLGSSDMKSGLSAMITSVFNLNEKPKRDIYMIFTADEESNALGIQNLISQKDFNIKNAMVIIGEPTDLNLRLGQKGILEIGFTLFGENGHASQANKKFNDKNNAIYKAIKIIKYFQKLENELCKKKDKNFGSSLINIGQINGGCSVNSIPEKCYFTVSIRLLPQINIKLLYKKIKKETQQIISEIQMKELFYGESFLTKTDNMAVKKIKNILQKLKYNYKIQYSSSWSEAGYLKKIGSCIVIGPGNNNQAHKADEYAEIDKLSKSVKIYNQLIRI